MTSVDENQLICIKIDTTTKMAQINWNIGQEKHTIHVEIQRDRNSEASPDMLEKDVQQYLLQSFPTLATDVVISNEELPTTLQPHVACIRINSDSDRATDRKHIAISNVELVFHIYQLESAGPNVEELPEAEEDEGIPAATHWLLPSADFHNLWDNLIYDTDIKEQLLQFVITALLFSDKGVDSNIISWNKVVLLHGPPGTGKTSLCKALAHKLSIRLNHRYSYGQLIEINSHSLFSKWFSESGKLVQKLFSKLQELVEDSNSLVCVLIDEVESLARSRSSSSASSEPGDAVRVVNALLTQLDQIKRHPNVLILTTSNLSGAVDLAFIDRADIKQYIGLPSQAAIYQIYHSCIAELIKVGLISSEPSCHLLTIRQLQITNMAENEATKPSLQLWNVAKCSAGLSGRSLRKLPFLAHALHLRHTPASLSSFLTALEAAVEKHKTDEQQLSSQD